MYTTVATMRQSLLQQDSILESVAQPVLQ